MTKREEAEHVRNLALHYIHEEQLKPRRTKARRYLDTLLRPLNIVFGLLA